MPSSFLLYTKGKKDYKGNFIDNGKPIMGGATAEQTAQIEINNDLYFYLKIIKLISYI